MYFIDVSICRGPVKVVLCERGVISRRSKGIPLTVEKHTIIIAIMIEKRNV